VEYAKGNGEYKLEYDLSRNRFFYKDNNDSFVFKQCRDTEDFDKTIETLKKEWENNGYKKTAEGFHDDNEAFLMQKIFEKVEKNKKSNDKKEENSYKNKNKDDLRKEYFQIVNNELPEKLSVGFEKAIEKYKKTDADETEICCILDIKNAKIIFVYGEGSDCESSDDENIFFEYSCDTLKKCKSMVDALDTLNLKQESSHWLADTINIVEGHGKLKDLSIAIYGNVQFGDIELDVIYEN
jgi:hypothetical protein